MVAAQPPIRSWRFDHGDLIGAEVASEPGAIRAGPLDTDRVQVAMRAEPGDQALVAGVGGRELSDAVQPASGVDGRGAVGGGMGVDPADDHGVQQVLLLVVETARGRWVRTGQ